MSKTVDFGGVIHARGDRGAASVSGDLGREALLAWDEQKARRARLAAEHGMPEHISNADALALARTALVPVAADVTADDIWASIYRDAAAADAWLESNLTHNGHPALARVPLPDGRVVGIMDMRPALARMRTEEDSRR